MDGNKTAVRPTSARAFALARATVVVFALATAADYVLDRYHLCSSQSQVCANLANNPSTQLSG